MQVFPYFQIDQIKLTLEKTISPRMLGYGVAVPEWGSVYGPAEPTDVFQLTEVSCKGDEQNLLDCALKSDFLFMISVAKDERYKFNIFSG